MVNSKFNTVLASTAGALIAVPIKLVVFFFIQGPDYFLVRETLFIFSLDALIAGWCWLLMSHIRRAAGLPAHTFKFDALGGALLTGGVAGVFMSIAIVFMKGRGSQSVPGQLQLLGKIAYILPLAIFFLLPSRFLMPEMLSAPELGLNKVAVKPDVSSPNVLLIVADTLRADTILEPNIPTPSLDFLRESGTWAESALAPCNQTLPSHLVLLTGFDIEKIGMRGNLSRWPTTKSLKENLCEPIAERFQNAGYNTAAVSTNMLLSSVNKEADHQDFAQGFLTWHGINYSTPFEDKFLSAVVAKTLMSLVLPDKIVHYPLRRLLYPNDIKNYLPHYKEGERTTNSTLKYLKELQRQDRPYFLMAQYLDPHSPYIAPDPIRNTIANLDSLPANHTSAPEEEYAMRVELRGYCRQDNLSAENFSPLSNYLHDLYKEEVAYFDEQLGRLLRQVGQDDRETIIVFVSDHGEGFGAHKNVEHGETLYNEELLVPFIISGPGVPKANELPFQPDLVDATRTLLELAGLSSSNIDGQNVLDPKYSVRPGVAVMMNHISVTSGRFKLIARLEYSENDTFYQLTPLYLYNLKNDPKELANLQQEMPDKVVELVSYLDSRLKQDMYPYIAPRELTLKQQGHLHELGYTE